MAELKATGDEMLVAIDFSPCSLRALDTALEWRREGAELTLLHVLDRVVIDQITWIGLGTPDEVLARMRTRAENELARLVSERAAAGVETMVVVGEPFVEIVKIANDLECDVIFIGIHGREAGLKQLLFGGTAEKVLRGANRPVLCVP